MDSSRGFLLGRFSSLFALNFFRNRANLDRPAFIQQMSSADFTAFFALLRNGTKAAYRLPAKGYEAALEVVQSRLHSLRASKWVHGMNSSISVPTKFVPSVSTSSSGAKPQSDGAPPLSSQSLLWLALTLGTVAIPIVSLISRIFAQISASPESYAMERDWILLSAVAALGWLWSLSGRAAPRAAASLFLLIVLGVHVQHEMQTGLVSALAMDIAGILFFSCAFAFRGPLRLWWYLFAPISAALLMWPIAYQEALQGASLAMIMRSALVPILSLVAGSLVIISRDTQGQAADAQDELDRLALRNRNLVKRMKSLEQEMKSLKTLVDGVVSPASTTLVLEAQEDSMNPVEFEVQSVVESSNSGFDHLTASPVVGFADLQRILHEELELVRARRQGQTFTKFELLAASDVSIPMAMRGDADSIRRAARACLERAADALGGGAGVVRLGLRPGLYSVVITIEDNGRGLSEDLLLKLESRGLGFSHPALSLTEIRQTIESLGGRFELNARLGVGSRFSLELPRVDAFASVARAPLRDLSRSTGQDSRHA